MSVIYALVAKEPDIVLCEENKLSRKFFAPCSETVS